MMAWIEIFGMKRLNYFIFVLCGNPTRDVQFQSQMCGLLRYGGRQRFEKIESDDQVMNIELIFTKLSDKSVIIYSTYLAFSFKKFIKTSNKLTTLTASKNELIKSKHVRFPEVRSIINKLRPTGRAWLPYLVNRASCYLPWPSSFQRSQSFTSDLQRSKTRR